LAAESLSEWQQKACHDGGRKLVVMMAASGRKACHNGSSKLIVIVRAC